MIPGLRRKCEWFEFNMAACYAQNDTSPLNS
jgi:hypothetical protein